MASSDKNVLTKILAHKVGEVASAKSRLPLAELKANLADLPPRKDFLAALRDAPGMGLIAEVKKASPSAGIIRPDFDPVRIAKDYEAAGAHCLSVLTDEEFFQGKLEYLSQIRQAVSLPLLRKDFLIDPYQVYEASVAGADAVLLIAECLDDPTLRLLYDTAGELGLATLIEIYDPENLPRVLALDAKLVGVNNRDLRTFTVNLEQTLQIQRNVPGDVLLVSESGIKTRDDVLRLQSAGVKAILVGETLMRYEQVSLGVHALLGT